MGSRGACYKDGGLCLCHILCSFLLLFGFNLIVTLVTSSCQKKKKKKLNWIYVDMSRRTIYFFVSYSNKSG